MAESSFITGFIKATLLGEWIGWFRLMDVQSKECVLWRLMCFSFSGPADLGEDFLRGEDLSMFSLLKTHFRLPACAHLVLLSRDVDLKQIWKNCILGPGNPAFFNLSDTPLPGFQFSLVQFLSLPPFFVFRITVTFCLHFCKIVKNSALPSTKPRP